VFKNRNTGGVRRELPCKTQPLKTFSEKNIHPVTLASFLFTGEKIFTVAAPKTYSMADRISSAATKEKDDAIKRLRR